MSRMSLPDDDELLFRQRCVCRPGDRNQSKCLLLTRYPSVDKNVSFSGDTGHDDVDVSVVDGKLVVSCWDIVMVVLSLVGYLADLITDWVVAYYHFIHGRHLSALLIAIFAVVPTLILNAVSFGWYLEAPYPMILESQQLSDPDESDERSNLNSSNKINNNNENASNSKRGESRSLWRTGVYWRFLACLLQLGPVLYHIDWLRHARQLRALQRARSQPVTQIEPNAQLRTLERQSSAMLACKLLQADRDATLLRMFEAFLEAAPQTLVQMHLLIDLVFIKQAAQDWNEDVHGHPPNYALMLVSIGCSIISLTWALVAQHRSLRLARVDKHVMTVTGCLMQFMWRCLTLCVRLFCMSVFTITFGYWLGAVLAVHYVVVIVHIKCCQAIDFGSHWLLETLVIGMGAFVCVFAPFNMAEGRTRWRYMFLYVLEATENFVMMICVIWVMPDDKQPFMSTTALIVCLAWVSGIAIMLLYYVHLHPNVLADQIMFKASRRQADHEKLIAMQMMNSPELFSSPVTGRVDEPATGTIRLNPVSEQMSSAIIVGPDTQIIGDLEIVDLRKVSSNDPPFSAVIERQNSVASTSGRERGGSTTSGRERRRASVNSIVRARADPAPADNNRQS